MLSGMMGTVAGIVTAAWLPAMTPLVLVVGTMTSVAICVKRCPQSLRYFLLCSLLGVGLSQLQLLDRVVWQPQGQGADLVELKGTVTGFPETRRFSEGGQRTRFEFSADQFPECTMLLSYYGDNEIRVGQNFRLTARLKPPWGLANPHSFNYQSYLLQNRICAVGYVRESSLVEIAAAPIQPPVYQQWRQAIRDHINSAELSESAQGLLAALVIGDRSSIPIQVWETIVQFGLSHLFVVSGLHVGLVAALGFGVGLLLSRMPLLRRLPLAHWIMPHLGALSLAVLFAALSGFALPAQRAVVMVIALQLSHVFFRRLCAYRSLVFALFVINLIDPLATHNPGLWLSFGAVCLIFVLLDRWQDLPPLCLLVQLQLALSLGMGLFASQWFGGLSVLAAIANLMAVPLVSFILVPLGLLFLVESTVGYSLITELVYFCFETTAELLEFLEQGDIFLGLSAWLSLQIQPLELLLAVLAVLLVWFCSYQRWVYIGATLFLPLLLGLRAQALAEGELELTVFDVGQGLSVLVRTQDRSLLYDTGAGDPEGFNMATSVLLPYLRSRRVQQLDELIISHSDRDHASGVKSLYAELEITTLYFGDREQPEPILQSGCSKGGSAHHGGLLSTQLHPELFRQQASDNELSCVVLLDFYGFRVLLPGDIGRETELALVRHHGAELGVDLLIVPHHGSLSSSSGPFVRFAAPEVAVVSAGYMNRFSHPKPAVIARYQRVNSRIYNTANSGAVTFLIRGGEVMRESAYRLKMQPVWL